MADDDGPAGGGQHRTPWHAADPEAEAEAERARLPLATRLMRLVDLPPLWTAATMAGVWAIARETGAILPPAVQVSGWLLIGLSVVLMLWAARHMMRAETAVMPHRAPRTLVRTGPFQYTRNPIYLGDLMVVIGFAMAMGQPLGAILVLPLGYVLQKRFIEPEEARLERAFDAAFRAWRAEIPRWF